MDLLSMDRLGNSKKQQSNRNLHLVFEDYGNDIYIWLGCFDEVFSYHKYHTILSDIFFSYFNILVEIQVWVLHCLKPYKPYKTYYFRMTVQTLLIIYDFCEKLSVVTLANSKTPWRHYFPYKSMKSRIFIFKNNAEKMFTIAKCWQKKKN